MTIACRYCTRPMTRRRSCSHSDTCTHCHKYLYCNETPPTRGPKPRAFEMRSRNAHPSDGAA